MRVLVTCVPQAGHVNAMLPLVAALARNDDVCVATAEDVRSSFALPGVTFRPAGDGFGAWYERLRARTRGLPGDGLPIERIESYFFPRLFGEIATDDMVDGVLAAAREWRADLVLHDAAAFAGPLVAAIVGCRSANHAFGALYDGEPMALTRDALSPLWRSFGLDVPLAGGIYRDLTIAICPPSMQRADLPSGTLHLLRPTPQPVRPPTPRSRPLVYVTFGTLWANVELLATIVEAVRDEPVDVVVTTGSVDPAELTGLPANVRAEAFIPQADLLPDCSAVIHHCGAGTMFAAVAHGLPQVALPQAADNFVNARMLAGAGAAVALQPGEVSADAVRAALRRVLGEPSYAEAARVLAAETDGMPAPEEVADTLRADVTGG